MNKHFRAPVIEAEPELICEAVKHEPGELSGYGICMDCGTNWSAAVGVYYCQFCCDDY